MRIWGGFGDGPKNPLLGFRDRQMKLKSKYIKIDLKLEKRINKAYTQIKNTL